MNMYEKMKKSPNTITDREGALLQVTKWPELGSSIASDKCPRRGDIVMLVASEEVDEFCGWVDVLHNEKVIRLHEHPRKWMWYFLPWPRGGFVDVDRKPIE